MKTAISIPNLLYKAAERYREKRKLSRSALYAKAVAEYLKHHSEENVTAELDAIYSSLEKSSLDPALKIAQQSILYNEDW